MKTSILFFLISAVVLTIARVFFCPYVPFTGLDVKLFMAMAHEINGMAAGAAFFAFCTLTWKSPIPWVFFALWLIPGLIEAVCFYLRVSN